MLQFDVVAARLASEYNVDTHIEPLNYVAARWVTGTPEALAAAKYPSQSVRTEDRYGNLVVLFTSTWEPIQDFKRTDADIAAYFMVRHRVGYTTQVDDPWFTAHRQPETSLEKRRTARNK